MAPKRHPLSQLDANESSSAKRSRLSDDDENSQRRAGTISRIILKNFMCHSLLDVDLTNHVNILVGKNGSGKSAILTALIVGLGGKASLTNRGTSVKGFIKAGKASATIELHIHNAGPMAYRPKIYGNKIIVCRHFLSSGGGNYKLKSESGEVVATVVRELHNITSSLNIQVDNPICILNQDTSRNFLSSNDPKHKFALFMKATKLEMLEEEYKRVRLNKVQSSNVWQEKRQSFEVLKQEHAALEDKMRSHRSIVEIRGKVKSNQVELLWAKVRDCEIELETDRKLVEEAQTKFDNVQRDCDTRAERVAQIKSEIQELTRQINELKDTIKVQSRPELDVKKAIEELTAKYDGKTREKTLIQNSITTKTKDAQLLREEIENANENMSLVEQEKLKRLRELTALGEKIRNMEDHIETLRNDMYQVSNHTAGKIDDQQALISAMSHLNSKINAEKQSLNALKGESDNSLLLYGRSMVRVKQMIEQNRHRFKQTPRGPLGAYIKLKNKNWAVAVESHLAGLLSSFTVDNAGDSVLLKNILDQVWNERQKPGIITSKFFDRKHNVEGNMVEAPNDCVSLYDAIEVEDAVVLNCLIDQLSIESILLIPNNDRAIELMSNRVYVPRKCSQGITVNGDKFFPDPNYKTYGSRYGRARFLQVDTKEHIAQLEQSLQVLSQEKQVLQGRMVELERELADHHQRKRELETKIEKLVNARTQVRRQLEQLKATAEPEIANVDMLEGELKEIEIVLREKKAALIRANEESAEIKEAISERKEKLKELQGANSSLEERLEELEGRVREEGIRQREISTSDDFDKKRLQKLETELKRNNEQAANREKSLEQFLQQAEKVGNRPENIRAIRVIMEEIVMLDRSARQIEASTANHEEILERYQMIHEKVTTTAEVLKMIKENIAELTLASERRNKHWEVTKNYFVNLIRRDFRNFLKSRNFEGSIEIDIQQKKLDLKVIPQKGSHDITTTSNLSGGERSFSTVAFLHSLWQCMDFPFYFLDEFDVFMDKLNRSIVFEILLQHADLHKDLQFVFLTPQDISFLNKNVSILKLADPERMPQ